MSNFNDLVAGDGQRFIDRFSGDTLRSWWTTRNVFLSPAFAMSDTINGGFEISVNAVNEGGAIDFNSKRPFDSVNSGLIIVSYQSKTTATRQDVRMYDQNLGGTPAHFYSVNYQQDVFSSWFIQSKDGTTQSNTQGTGGHDTNPHKHHVTSEASAIKYFKDDIFNVIKTTNLPNSGVKQQPTWYGGSTTSHVGTTTFNITYLEAYNF